MASLLSILCLVCLASCARTDYVLPPKAIIVPVETAELRKATTETRKEVTASKDASREVSRKIEGATVTVGEVEKQVAKAKAEATAEQLPAIEYLEQTVARLRDEVMDAWAHAITAQEKAEHLERTFDERLESEVRRVEIEASENKQGIKQSDQVYDSMAGQIKENQDFEKKFIAEEESKKMWRMIALLVIGFLLLTAFLRLFGAALWTAIKAHNPFARI